MMASKLECEVWEKLLREATTIGTNAGLKIYEDLYDVDVHKAFEKLCEANLGISGMRLDLFFDSNETR